MQQDNGKYNIKAVSQMLGIQPGTLRAWERRYHIVSPIRNEAGHRLYSDEHVRVLKGLLTKVREGFTISQAVSLYENNEMRAAGFEDSMTKSHAESLRDRLLVHLLSFDEKQAKDTLDQAFGLFSIDKVMADVITPMMNEIGSKWERAEISSAHEHYVSSFIRTRIGMVMQAMPVHDHLPRAVAVCSPDNRHELGLLMFSLYLKRKGFPVIFLGTSIDKRDVEAIVEEANPGFLFFSATMKDQLKETVKWTDEWREKFPALHIGIGGLAVTESVKQNPEYDPDVVIGPNMQEWEYWLEKKLSKK